MCYSFISKVKWSFLTASGQCSCFQFLFWFSYTILFSKMKFFSENLPNSSCHFGKLKSVFLQTLHQSAVPSSILFCAFLAQTSYTLLKRSSLKCKFFRFLSARVKIRLIVVKILKRQVNSSLDFASFFIAMTHNFSVNFKLIHLPIWIKGSHQSPNYENFEYSVKHLLKCSCHLPNL